MADPLFQRCTPENLWWERERHIFFETVEAEIDGLSKVTPVIPTVLQSLAYTRYPIEMD